MANEKHQLLSHIDLALMIVERGKVTFANAAAQALLGTHVVGWDVRLALRDPGVIALLRSEINGKTRVAGLSVPGSIWEISSHLLDDGSQMVALTNVSAQASIAKAHADFVANASHELRTPLASIIGYVETLEDEKAGSDPATRERFLGTIKREAQRMQALIEDLMALSRIEGNRHSPPAEVVDLIAICRETACELPSISLNIERENVRVFGDRGQLSQVFRNLLDNAQKHGAPGKPVNMTLHADNAGWATVTIKDEGEGISPEHLPRLTQRFYRADPGRSRSLGGTGLGLSIVKHIVMRHRGHLDISSTLGVGTTVTVLLPMCA